VHTHYPYAPEGIVRDNISEDSDPILPSLSLPRSPTIVEQARHRANYHETGVFSDEDITGIGSSS
jgi:hypothetical protein